MNSGPVAVIDIGSNSIKALVADRAPDGSLRSLATKSLDARISAGISRDTPRLSEDGISRGLAAIRELLDFTAPHAPEKIILVATSAVRDAHNGAEFRERVLATTGCEIRILSGDEEANLIGRGLTADPALAHLRDFYVFDLGGGSLECLTFRERRIEQAVSLRLGCVRLTEKFVADRELPVPPEALVAIGRHTREILSASSFTFSLPRGAVVVGAGGTITTARAIFAVRAGCELDRIDPSIALGQFRTLLAELAAMPLSERQHVDGLPPERADVYPAALATLIALAEVGQFPSYLHSLYNLRYGLAADALSL